MKIPGFTRITKSDFAKEMQDLVEKLGNIINRNTEVIYELANKKVSIRDNILCSVRDVTIQVDASGIPLTPTSAALDTSGTVDGVTVINVQSNSTNVFPTTQPFIAYTPKSESINIDKVTGLLPGYTWFLRIIIWQR